MPLQNRVTPLGELITHPGRGLVYGNWGCLHYGDGRVRRRYSGKRWIACRLRFRGWHRAPLMAPGRFTELFFLDEVTALAAGHRPCALAGVGSKGPHATSTQSSTADESRRSAGAIRTLPRPTARCAITWRSTQAGWTLPGWTTSASTLSKATSTVVDHRRPRRPVQGAARHPGLVIDQAPLGVRGRWACGSDLHLAAVFAPHDVERALPVGPLVGVSPEQVAQALDQARGAAGAPVAVVVGQRRGERRRRDA